jgi:hypothetical protein
MHVRVIGDHAEARDDHPGMVERGGRAEARDDHPGMVERGGHAEAHDDHPGLVERGGHAGDIFSQTNKRGMGARP